MNVPLPGATLGQTLGFEIPIGAVDRVGIDGDLLDHVADGRELIARFENSESECLADLVDHLPIGRYAGLAIEPESNVRPRRHRVNVL